MIDDPLVWFSEVEMRASELKLYEKQANIHTLKGMNQHQTLGSGWNRAYPVEHHV